MIIVSFSISYIQLTYNFFISQLILENIQTTTLQEPSTRQHFEKQSRSEHSSFSYNNDDIGSVDEMDADLSSILIQSSGTYIRHVPHSQKSNDGSHLH